jgi:hypothetical protein
MADWVQPGDEDMLTAIEADSRELALLASKPSSLPRCSSRAFREGLKSSPAPHDPIAADLARDTPVKFESLVSALLSAAVASARASATMCENAELSQALPPHSHSAVLKPREELIEALAEELENRMRNRFVDDPAVLSLVEEIFLPASGERATEPPISHRVARLLRLVQGDESTEVGEAMEPEWVTKRVS